MSLKADTIYVSNLDSSIGEADLRNDVFIDLGPINSVVINYDKTGTSLGTATVQFSTADYALKAYKDFNGAKIDGREMFVRLIAEVPQQRTIVKKPAPPAAPAAARKVAAAAPAPRQRLAAPTRPARQAAPSPAPKSAPRRANARAATAAPRAAARPTTRVAQSRKPAAAAGRKAAPAKPARKAKTPAKKPSVADLDAQLEKYNAGRQPKE